MGTIIVSSPAIVAVSLVLVAITMVLPLTEASRLPNLYWNSSNPQFHATTRLSVDDDHGSGSMRIEARLLDKLDIVCPHYQSTDLDSGIEPETMKIYQVSELSYISCELDQQSKLFAVCDRPLDERRISLVFRSFSPLPNGFEYKPGRSYFLISTSNGSNAGINNTRLGLCTSQNMRLRIDIALNEENGDYGGDSAREEGTVVEGEKSVNAMPLDASEEARGKTVDSDARRVNPKFESVDSAKKPNLFTSLLHALATDAPRASPLSNTQVSTTASSTTGTAAYFGRIEMFAQRNGLELDRVLYVGQRAMDGVEGEVSFLQLEKAKVDRATPAAVEAASATANNVRASPRERDLPVRETNGEERKMNDDVDEYVRQLETDEEDGPDVSYQIHEQPQSYPVVGSGDSIRARGQLLCAAICALLFVNCIMR